MNHEEHEPKEQKRARAPHRRSIPTMRDTRIREAMLALLTEGSTRKAAAKTNIPFRTIAAWAASDEGRRVIDDLKGSIGARLAEKFLALVDQMLNQYQEAVQKREIPPSQLPIHIGIFTDKATRLLPNQTSRESGDVIVEVKFGGTRIPTGPTLDAETVDDDVADSSVTITAKR